MSQLGDTEDKTVSLVLSSGGARGLAHIGAIQWLTENGYSIRSIAGSSIGALIGGIYATGKLELYTDWVLALERTHVLRLLDLSFGRSGLFKGERVIAVLRELIGECDIEDLPIAFTAVATQLGSGKEVWLRKGKLFDAIRASMATPLLFTPFAYEGGWLLDGGLINPIPIAPTLNDSTELTIAVNLSSRAEQREQAPLAEPGPTSPYRTRIREFMNSLRAQTAATQNAARERLGFADIAFAAMETMQTTIARLKLASYSADVTIEIPRNACSYYEFWRAKELIALGRERAERALSLSSRTCD